MSDKSKPTHVPQALYSCYLCAEDRSWPAGDLNWCGRVSHWMCELCWDREEHGEVGVRLDFYLKEKKK